MEELVRYIVGELVDNKEAYTVESSEQDGITVINIGKQGRIAKSIRTLVKAAAGSNAKKISVEIIER